MLSEIELLKLEFQRQILTGKLNFSASDILNIINYASSLTHKNDIKETINVDKKLCKYHQ
jgi:hypothetical protein